MEGDPHRLAFEVLRFARDRLGPASEQLLSDPAVQVLALSRIRNGYDVEDAVLVEVHTAASRDRRVADEFVAYFLNDLLKLGHRLRSSALERFLDTGDLVQSVLGDLWEDLSRVRFETRGRFLSYLSRRLGWKAADRVRGLQAGTRREDRRLDLAPENLHMGTSDPSPSHAAAAEEDRGRLAMVLLRLSDRDRELLTHFLKGRSLGEIAEQVGISYDAARVALQRALRRARRSW